MGRPPPRRLDRSRLDDADMARRTVNYLARYVDRVAISNERLIAIDGEEVLFYYKDYRDENERKIKRMPGIEFIVASYNTFAEGTSPHSEIWLHGAVSR